MTDEPRIGDNLRYWRRRRGYSQEELAARAGLSVNVVRRLEQDDETAGQRSGVRLESLYTRGARSSDGHVVLLAWSRAGGPGPDPFALLPIRVALTPPLSITGRPTTGRLHKEPDLRVQNGQLEEAVRSYHEHRYEGTALLLPEMIIQAHEAVAYYDRGEKHIEALRLRMGVLQLAGWFLTQVTPASDLAYQAIKDAIVDANAVGDALEAAAVLHVMSEDHPR